MEDELLDQLALEAKQLTLAAQQDPSRNLQRRRVLDRLLTQIMRSKRLARPQQGQWNPTLYQDLWNEALSQTMLEIARRIGDYNPEYAILAWVNKTLSYRFNDVLRDYYSSGMTGLPRPNGNPSIGKIPSLDQLSNRARIRSLDQLDNYSPDPTNLELLHQFIRDDPEKKLTEHIKGCPKATFRLLLLARLDGQSWEEISRDLRSPPIPKQTLCSFFERKLRKQKTYFQKHLSE